MQKLMITEGKKPQLYGLLGISFVALGLLLMQDMPVFYWLFNGAGLFFGVTSFFLSLKQLKRKKEVNQ